VVGPEAIGLPVGNGRGAVAWTMERAGGAGVTSVVVDEGAAAAENP